VAELVAHKSLRETVVEAIREMILSGELERGERLTEDKLAERLGVSRNPIREAIHALEATGLVNVIPRRGAYVASIDAEHAVRIQEIRGAIEAWVVHAAAERHDAADLARIDEAIRVGKKASRTRDYAAAANAHREFHLALEAATKNEYLTSIMDPLRQRTELVFSVLAGGRSRNTVQWDEHEAIRDAVAARDSGLARQLMAQHIDHALSRYGQIATNDLPPLMDSAVVTTSRRR
jgi:DNA-binding GntR family transcriptional regulator